MNNRELNKYEMLVAVYGYYLGKKTAANFNRATTSVFEGIHLIVKEIELNEKTLQEGNKGKIASRDVTQDELSTTALVVAGALYGYAAGISDTELLNVSDINSSSLKRMRNSELPIFVESLFDKADSIGDGLIAYGVSAEYRTSARTLLNDYLSKYGEVNSGKTSKSKAHENVRLLLTKADEKLKVLDKLMFGVKVSNPDLYTEYESARVIIDKAVSHNTGSSTENKDAGSTSNTATTVN